MDEQNTITPGDAEMTAIPPEAEAPLSGGEPETAAPPESAPDGGAEPDYARQAELDLAEIGEMRPEYRGVDHLAELPFALRFAELREMGLSVAEALTAAEVRDGGKSALRPIRPRAGAERPDGITHEQMQAARELFGDGMSDREIRELYRRVSR